MSGTIEKRNEPAGRKREEEGGIAFEARTDAAKHMQNCLFFSSWHNEQGKMGK